MSAMSILEPEAGIFYAVCWVVVIIRLISRRMHLGAWKHLQLDDYLIVMAMVTATVLLLLMQEVVKTSSNLIPADEDVSTLSENDIMTRVYGSKLVLVVEQMQIATIWLIKACLLIMYNRMTLVLPQHIFVQATAVYVFLGFVVMEILYFGVWCRPFNQYWAVPTYSVQCSAATNHLITNAVLNISSDLIIISIPLPLLFKVRLPMKNKIVLFVIFLIGAFTIVAAILNKYYSFTHPFGTEWTVWYLRESFTALLCANLPLTYPLIQRIFKLKNWSHNSSATYGTQSQTQTTARFSWATRKIMFKPKALHIAGRRPESQERIHHSFDTQNAGNNAHFITSAIAMEDVKSADMSSIGSPGTSNTWRSSHVSSKDFAFSHAV
ncbi:hypothetical protein P153DRAFT_168780 [Dothidotthia symphoricarpi CBS 119687]|uniref:Rhodopsin domain-containing protein n=1 Tax=Dothidotthia symphoricarpi CBS 119687 TaxID=1392245 RepID=A0A6A6AKY9_9PLEO|nr:uncharacterized protein P153DRAFT_168780 [Dothidotthia symphoricarpi CBS 119687]KAF2132632.1 hypothetical protein P153DRAFT_168780 [Dothidotthia symphoricarpi CBS 119687]